MVIVIATPNEIELVKKLGYNNNPIIITGVGGVNVIRALKHLPKDTEILNIGYAGSNSIPIGMKVCVSSSQLLHENVDYVEEKIDLDCYIDSYANFPCYTSTDFVTKTKIENYCVFDMELAFICAMFDDVKAIKVVSDNLSLKQYEENVEGKNAD